MIWRTHLTGEEKQTVLYLDNEIEEARSLATQLTAQREIIRRRATARGKRKMESVKTVCVEKDSFGVCDYVGCKKDSMEMDLETHLEFCSKHADVPGIWETKL